MSAELPTAISGTFRTYQLLRDNTLRIVIDIDPRFKGGFHRLFPDNDIPIAVAPLALNFERIEREEEPKPGPLCRLACIWCKDEDHFWEWLVEVQKLGAVDEEQAAIWLKDTCGIDSRKELDQNEWAAERFQRSVRTPFMEWMKNR